jgi:hypothetical protein
MCGGGGGILKGLSKAISGVFKSVGSVLGFGDEPTINIPKNQGIATENMASGDTGALVELGAQDKKNQRVSGGGSGSRSRSGLAGLGGGSGLGW